MHKPLKTSLPLAVSLLGAATLHGDVASFQDGVGGYTGTADTWIASASASGGGDETATNYGSVTSLKVEDDPAQSDGQGLLRFDNIFGNGAGQIPLGSTITSATLSMTTVNGGFASVPNAPGIHEMLVAWDEGTVTWDTFDTSPGGADGGMLPGVEYNGTAVDDANFGLANGETGVWDVTPSLQAWSAGGTNHGWMFFGDTNNGWDAYTSEFDTIASRPLLTVDFVAPDPGAPTLASSDINDDQSGGPVSINTLVTYTVTFSEDMDDSTVTAVDFDNAGTADATVSSVTEASPGEFVVEVTPTSAGTLQLRVPIGAILTDAEGSDLNTVADILDDDIIIVDPVPGIPTLSSSDITDDQGGGPVTANTVVTYTVIFSEDMDSSTVTTTDFDNAGSATTTISSVLETSPGEFEVEVVPTSTGTLQLRVPAGAVLADPEGNTLDTTVPITDDVIITVEGAVLAPFTVAMIPDTQYYNGANLVHFNNQTQWIVDNRVADNIVMVSHFGDIVNSGGSLSQWTGADAAMQILDGVPVQPYGAVLGNHDYQGGSHPDADATNYIAYFGEGRYAGRHWYGDDSPDGRNHYHYFNAGGRKFLHLVLEFQAASTSNSNAAEVVTWAQGVLDANPGTPTILTTHEYLGGSGSRSSAGDDIFNALVKVNSQVFMVLGGHVLGESHSTATNDAGQDVFQILANFQGRANGGDGWMALAEFDEANDVIDITTYSPSLDASETDANSQYSFAMDFNARLGPIGNGPWVVPGVPSGIADDAATLNGEVLSADADDVTLVWALADEGDTIIADWTSASGGGSHSFGAVAEDTPVNHVITSLPGDTKFHYRFVTNVGTDSNWSSVKAFATGLGGLPAPSGLAAVPGNTITLTKMDLSWSDSFANETGFLIQRSTDPGFGTVDEFNVAANETTYTDLTTAPNTTYHYRIAGVDGSGPGPFSAGVSASTGDEPAADTLLFREGEDNGYGTYTGTLDINPRGGPQGNQTLSYGADAGINIEDDPAQQDGQGLIRFENIFGNGTGQIPLGATITSATLEVTTLGGGNANTSSGPNVHRMLTSWDESDANGSWNHFVGGVDFNDVEAASTPEDSLSGSGIANGETVSFDVLASLQAWSAGATNHGWVLMGTTNNRWDIHSSESFTPAARPVLIVIYEPSVTPSDYTAWASGYPGADLDDPDGDLDGDGLKNGLEAWFGTHPGQFNVGVSILSSNGTTTTFEHPQNDDPPSDLSGFYEWSSNLNDWYASGSGPGGGPTVSFVPNTVGTTTTVTATASEALDNLFLRVGVTQN